VVTNGGRVICATALGEDLDEALLRSKKLVKLVNFEGKYFRRDIGFEFF
jgi:phosphoribosylamine--glycine ligase